MNGHPARVDCDGIVGTGRPGDGSGTGGTTADEGADRRGTDPPVDVTAAVAAAIRAPSLHNRQPWRFRVGNGGIELRTDPSGRLPASDPTGWAERLAAGAALFNLRLAVAGQGWEPVVRPLPEPADPALLAVVSPGAARPPTATERRLAAAIWRWRSNRSSFRPDPVPASVRSRLVSAARSEGGWLELLIGPGPARAVGELADAADRLLMRNPAYRAELCAGARAAGTDRPSGAGAEWPADLAPDELPVRRYGPGEGTHGAAQPVVAVLGTDDDSAAGQLAAGQALQRVLLTATDDGLAASLVSQPIEVPSIREQLRLALGQYGSPQMVLRLGYGGPQDPAEPGGATARRPVTSFIEQPAAC